MSTINVIASPVNGVKEALKSLALDTDLMKFIKDNADQWASFGKMDSHKYRAWLYAKFKEANLTAESIFMVHFFAGVIKNRDRILTALNERKDEWGDKAWYAPVIEFFDKHTQQYVKDGKMSNSGKGHKARFPVVNIPTSMPAIDILVFCLITSPEERTIENMMLKTTASQLFLADDMQSLAEAGYKIYWNDVVKGTKNTASNLEEPKYREDYYKNPKSDRYLLITKNLKIQEPADKIKGYTRTELESYLKTEY